MGAAIIMKAAMIQVSEGPHLRKLAEEMHTRFDTLKADRGNIYTEDGVLLSSSIPEFDVHIDFAVIDSEVFAKNIDTLSLCMSRLFADKTPDQYKTEFVQAYENEERYHLLGKNLKYYEFEQLRSFPIFNKGKGYGGFIVDTKEKRETPFNSLAFRTIGIYRDSNITGLESTYNSTLKGKTGSRIVQKSTGNLWVPIEGSEVEPVNGRDIVTSLDMNIQDAAEHSLMSILQKYECQYGTCIVMEVATGKVRSLVNLGRQKDGSYFEDFNYALVPTEPGSTFKAATLISLLNDKMVNVDNTVNAEGGKIRFGSRVMRDSHLGLGVMPIWKAFAESSNAAFAKLAYTHYSSNPERFVKRLKELRLNMVTGIDLAGERKPRVKSPHDKDSSWSNTTLPWMATGYEVLISPLHTCMLYNAVANNGKMMKPYLVTAIREYGKDVKVINPQNVATIGDSSTVSQIQRCMKAVVSDGTAKTIESPYYTMAGKTGTAQVADGRVKYADGVYQGSFVGFFPADAPKYTICVVIRTKAHSKAYYGGAIAAPVFRMVADKIFSANMGAWSAPLDTLAKNGGGTIQAKMATARNYRVLLNAINKPSVTPAEFMNVMMRLTIDSTKNVQLANAGLHSNVVPDVTGMGLKDAVYMLENFGLIVRIEGKGKVKGQSLSPGTRIKTGTEIILQLS